MTGRKEETRKMKGLPDNLTDQLLRLQPGQTMVLHFRDTEKAKAARRKIRDFVEEAMREGILSLQISVSFRSSPNGGGMVLVFCEEPITVEVIEVSDTGDPVLREKFEVTL